MRPQYPYQRSKTAFQRSANAPTNGMSTPFQRGVFQPPPIPPCIDRGHGGHPFGDIVDTFPISGSGGWGCHFARCL